MGKLSEHMVAYECIFLVYQAKIESYVMHHPIDFFRVTVHSEHSSRDTHYVMHRAIDFFRVTVHSKHSLRRTHYVMQHAIDFFV